MRVSSGFIERAENPNLLKPSAAHPQAVSAARPVPSAAACYDPSVRLQRRNPFSRRTCLLLAALQPALPRWVSARTEEWLLPPKTHEINHFFNGLVYILQQRLDGFDARLTWYTDGKGVPPGPIGDPAKDYKSSGRFGDGHCGPFLPGQDRPYAICPLPGRVAADATAQSCCRHFAYLSPYSPTARSNLLKVSTIVVAPRLASLQDDVWKSMMMHELGHAIDVHVFGSRYRLRDHPVSDPETAALLDHINAEEDFEARADLLGNALLAPSVGRPLCYDPGTLLQTLVPPGVQCSGSGAAGDERPMKHYRHDVLAGFAP